MRLVKDWRQTWRYFSVWSMTATGAIQAAWLAIPEGMKASLPDNLVNAVSLVLLALGVIGRMVKQDDK